MAGILDTNRFGPWALITGASSGLGREFVHRVAGLGINVVLVARRESLLKELGEEIFRQFRVEYRVVATDLVTEDFMKVISKATGNLDIGLVISNAG